MQVPGSFDLGSERRIKIRTGHVFENRVLSHVSPDNVNGTDHKKTTYLENHRCLDTSSDGRHVQTPGLQNNTQRPCVTDIASWALNLNSL